MGMKVFMYVLLSSGIMLLFFSYYSSTSSLATNSDQISTKAPTTPHNFDPFGLPSPANVSIIINQGRAIKVKTKEFEDDKELILLISPLGRAGSSWLGEILMSTHNSVAYIYEPVMVVQKILKTKLTDSLSEEIISDVLGCQMQQDMMSLKKAWPRVFTELEKGCGPFCKTISDYNVRCQSSKTVLTKTIRLRLSSVENLLSKRSYQHLKVIYLARDPRAQIQSRMLTFNSDQSGLDNDCQMVTSTVWAFHRLSRIFPGHLYLMRYEDICQDPLGEATKLWKFLRTDHAATLPENWRRYLIMHERKVEQKNASKGRQNPYSLYKQTSTEWFKWREEMDINSTLNIPAIEKECGVAMKYLGYLPLKTVENVKDLSLPFLGKMDCDFLNCWSFRF